MIGTHSYRCRRSIKARTKYKKVRLLTKLQLHGVYYQVS